MNRTDRLYAIVEELRAIAPRTRSARRLAERYEVSVRTIERDISALQQAGVPIHADTGRRGGYGIDRSMTLPPLNFTPAEAVAVAAALHGSPLRQAGRSALQKILAAMPAHESEAAEELANRVRFLTSITDQARPDTARISAVIEDALLHSHVLRLVYQDKQGTITEREIEPGVFVCGPEGWYVLGWCRLRAGMRVFRLDRILGAVETGEPSPRRSISWSDPAAASYLAHPASLR